MILDLVSEIKFKILNLLIVESFGNITYFDYRY